MIINMKPIVIERRTYWDENEMVMGNKIDGVFREAVRLVVPRARDRLTIASIMEETK